MSRSYYAAYNVSRSVRYLVKGFVKFDAEDHRIVGDLPTDFPGVRRRHGLRELHISSEAP